MTSRRHKLEGIRPAPDMNAGLWFDKFLLTQSDEDAQSRRNLVNETSSIGPLGCYTEFFKRWKTSLDQAGAQMREAVVQGRMVVGLGDESVLETAITLHHTYGVPVIPGSALKGLTASFARNVLEDENWRKDQLWYKIAFGAMEAAGFVTFFDALYVPDSGKNKLPLHADVISVHHAEYYQGKDKAPSDWDDPVVIPFLTATGKYLIALSGPEEWVSAVFDILRLALSEMGIGAKTSSGYGRLRLDLDKIKKPAPPPKPVDPDQAKADELIQQINQIWDRDVSQQLGSLASQISSLDNQAQRARVAAAVHQKIKSSGWKRAKENPWYQTMLDNLKT